jgi:iron complex outermembrane receptor protein
VTKTSFRRLLAGGAAAAALLAMAGQSAAQQRTFDLAAQPAVTAIAEFGRQAGVQVIAPSESLRGLRTPAIRGELDARAALRRLIAGSKLEIAADTGSVITLRARRAPAAKAAPRAAQDAPVARRRPADAPPPATDAPPQVSEGTVEEVVVTARRMEERLIDVPIAVSAFSEERLADLKIDGGAELLRAIPNVNFSKDNFTGYNFSIRGIGTKAISVTTDPAVAISFNNTTLLRNRLFEQEYFDVQRLEVLRGPQGTLYGRNATAGVVNMLPNLPKLGTFSGEVQGELGNYDSRRARGYLNIPLGDTLALRVAGAMTQRGGYDYNTVTDQNVNGRDLWSTRIGLLWAPTDRFRANVLWEHFSEDDDRSRTGKQLCTRGETPASVDWTDPDGGQHTSAVVANNWTGSSLTPGCQAASLYTDKAFGAPNGIGFPIVTGLILTTPFRSSFPAGSPEREKWGQYLFQEHIDPFSSASGSQSRNLREISTFYDPVFQAKNDVIQLNFEMDLTDDLTFNSQTLYMEDSYNASQDYFRIEPMGGLMACRDGRDIDPAFEGYLGACTGATADPHGGGTFIDPQLGAQDSLVAVDMSRSNSKQWSQEFRLSSSFDGPVNFNLGANYLKFETQEDYYVFSNAFTISALGQNAGEWSGTCEPLQPSAVDPNACTYIDPNPINKLDGDGHNYFRSINLAKTESWAVFGEGYFILSPGLRLTVGLRYTDDEKTTTPVPTQLLSSTNPFSGATVGKGYPRYPDEVLGWGEWTGRLALDWKPQLSFTNDTLLYASYSRGYKGGGANPRGPDDGSATNYSRLPSDFAPEFVDAYELGMKNVLLDGKMTLNGSAFYYDYSDYQVTQVIDRTLHNENFDAKIYGLEFEAAWSPTRNFRLDATLGLLRTRIADGETSIDVMDRLQGHDDWMVMRPWPTSPATCVVPKEIVGRFIDSPASGGGDNAFVKLLCPGPYIFNIDGLPPGFNPGSLWGQIYGDQWGPLEYNPITDAPNQGRGFAADLSGNSLPNAPEMTFNIGAQYRIQAPGGWQVVVRGDYYRQSESYMRVYNTEYDRLKAWDNANLSMTITRDGSPLMAQIYVKNLFDATPITDGFTGPDEIGNTTNVFTLDPRLIGVSVKASF